MGGRARAMGCVAVGAAVPMPGSRAAPNFLSCFGAGNYMLQRSHDAVSYLAVHQPRINLLEDRPIACAPAAGFALFAANMALNE